MKCVSAKLNEKFNTLKVYLASDWHLGDKHCDIKTIKQTIEDVKNQENAYLICNGDLINNATKSSVSDCYAEELSPQEQVDLLMEYLEPIKDKILIMTQGNHESRTNRNDGIDITRFVARQLGIEDKYCAEGGVLFLRFGKGSGNLHYNPIRYTFYVTHGYGGGRKEGGKANKLADLAEIVDSDIYIISHTHFPMTFKEGYYRIDNIHDTVAFVEKLFVNTAATLNYGGYGQVFSFKPPAISNPVIILNGHKKEINVNL